MRDTISRQDVIDMLMSEDQNEPRYPEWYASKVEEIEEVRDLEPKRPEGYWNMVKVGGGDYAICSECGLTDAMIEDDDGEGLVMGSAVYGEKFARFCSNCGARMIGGEASDH